MPVDSIANSSALSSPSQSPHYTSSPGDTQTHVPEEFLSALHCYSFLLFHCISGCHLNCICARHWLLCPLGSGGLAGLRDGAGASSPREPPKCKIFSHDCILHALDLTFRLMHHAISPSYLQMMSPSELKDSRGVKVLVLVCVLLAGKVNYILFCSYLQLILFVQC